MTLANGAKFFGANLVQNQYGPALFADLFFFITGFHGTHVFSGIILLIIFCKHGKWYLSAPGPLRNGRENWFILALCRFSVGIRIYLLLPGVIKLEIKN